VNQKKLSFTVATGLLVLTGVALWEKEPQVEREDDHVSRSLDTPQALSSEQDSTAIIARSMAQHEGEVSVPVTLISETVPVEKSTLSSVVTSTVEAETPKVSTQVSTKPDTVPLQESIVESTDVAPLKWDPVESPMWWKEAFPKVNPELVSPEIRQLTNFGEHTSDRYEKINQVSPQNITPADTVQIMRYLSETLPLPAVVDSTKEVVSEEAKGVAADHQPDSEVKNTQDTEADASVVNTTDPVPQENSQAQATTSEEITEKETTTPPRVLTEEQRRRLQDSLAENAIKNDLLEVLLNVNPMPDDLGEMMLTVVVDPAQSPVWRDYVIQHYSVYLENIILSQGLAKAQGEMAQFRQSYLEQASAPRSTAATSLMGMDLLAQKGWMFDDENIAEQAKAMIDREGLSAGAKATAWQIYQERTEENDFELSAQLASDESRPFAERLVAVHHLGQGGPEQISALKNLLNIEETYPLKRAVEASLKRLEEVE
jgi:hypothetical protein